MKNSNLTHKKNETNFVHKLLLVNDIYLGQKKDQIIQMII
jgi:hypothetical protein